MMALQWKPPRGHADIAPSQFEQIENDGYLTIDAHWIIPALLRRFQSRVECSSRPPVVDISPLNCGARGSMSHRSICIAMRILSCTTSGSAISAG